MSSLFRSDGDAVVPTDLARGPWSLDALHGGPVAALLARAAERHAPPWDTQLVRLTVELLRPVPVAPLTAETAVLRPGRRVTLLETVLRSGDGDVARSRALFLRRQDVPVPEAALPIGPELPDPEQVARALPGDQLTGRPAAKAFHTEGAEMRFVAGGFGVLGPATVWVRLRVPLLAGEDPTPVQRVAAAADFGNGVSSPLQFGHWSFINADLTVHLFRPPVGEWICLDARTSSSTSGAGLAESALSDRRGPIGRSLQSLLVEPM